jgi:hypothetical protein
MYRYIIIAAPIAAAALNVLMTFRSMRSIRWNQEIRRVLLAYERELLERGVTDLPPRCIECCQILPGHVRGCAFGAFLDYLGKGTEYLTRPPIKYYRRGTKPPDLGGKNA